METPTIRLLAAARQDISTTDAAGRTLSVRRLDALDRLRLFKTLGPSLSLNTAYLGMALIAVAVASIDGVPIPPPVTEEQLESLVRRLGDDGIAAVADALDAAESDGGIDPGN